MTKPVKIDIWSDIACPWCYIGKRKFEAGVRLAGADVEVEYHSFELAPDTPVDYAGTEVEYLANRKGVPAEQAARMLDGVTAVAKEVGLAYDFGAVHPTRTLLAHELLHLAKAHGRQAELQEILFRAYFVDGGRVGRIDDLVTYAVQAGLDAEVARASLERHEFADAVQRDIAQAAAYGIQGVPFFVIDGRYGVSGAQAPEVFAQALEQVAAELAVGVDG